MYHGFLNMKRRRLVCAVAAAGCRGDLVSRSAEGLARSTFDLFAIVKRIVDAGAHFRSLAELWADTSTSTGRLMIAVLGGLADVERDLIRTRTAEGRAQGRGVSLWAVLASSQHVSSAMPWRCGPLALRLTKWPSTLMSHERQFPGCASNRFSPVETRARAGILRGRNRE